MTIKRDEGYVGPETMIARGYSGIKIIKRKTVNPEDFIPLIEINVTISMEALQDLVEENAVHLYVSPCGRMEKQSSIASLQRR